MYVICDACDFPHAVIEVRLVDIEANPRGYRSQDLMTFICPKTDKVAQSRMYSGSGAVVDRSNGYSDY